MCVWCKLGARARDVDGPHPICDRSVGLMVRECVGLGLVRAHVE